VGIFGGLKPAQTHLNCGPTLPNSNAMEPETGPNNFCDSA